MLNIKKMQYYIGPTSFYKTFDLQIIQNIKLSKYPWMIIIIIVPFGELFSSKTP